MFLLAQLFKCRFCRLFLNCVPFAFQSWSVCQKKPLVKLIAKWYWEFCSETSRLCVWGVHNFHFQGVIPNHSALQSIHNFPTSPVFRSRSLKLRLHYLWTNNKPYLILSPSMEVVLTFSVQAQSTTTCDCCWVEHKSVLRRLTMLGDQDALRLCCRSPQRHTTAGYRCLQLTVLQRGFSSQSAATYDRNCSRLSSLNLIHLEVQKFYV